MGCRQIFFKDLKGAANQKRLKNTDLDSPIWIFNTQAVFWQLVSVFSWLDVPNFLTRLFQCLFNLKNLRLSRPVVLNLDWLATHFSEFFFVRQIFETKYVHAYVKVTNLWIFLQNEIPKLFGNTLKKLATHKCVVTPCLRNTVTNLRNFRNLVLFL